MARNKTRRRWIVRTFLYGLPAVFAAFYFFPLSYTSALLTPEKYAQKCVAVFGIGSPVCWNRKVHWVGKVGTKFFRKSSVGHHLGVDMLYLDGEQNTGWIRLVLPSPEVAARFEKGEYVEFEGRVAMPRTNKIRVTRIRKVTNPVTAKIRESYPWRRLLGSVSTFYLAWRPSDRELVVHVSRHAWQSRGSKISASHSGFLGFAQRMVAVSSGFDEIQRVTIRSYAVNTGSRARRMIRQSDKRYRGKFFSLSVPLKGKPRAFWQSVSQVQLITLGNARFPLPSHRDMQVAETCLKSADAEVTAGCQEVLQRTQQ